MQIRLRLFALMWKQIQFSLAGPDPHHSDANLETWSDDPSRLHWEPSWLHYEPSWLHSEPLYFSSRLSLRGSVANTHNQGWGIRVTLMRFGIRIQLFTLMRIRIHLFTLMRIRIQLFMLMRIRILDLIKVMGICDLWSLDPPGLHFEPPGLHREGTRPSTALF